MRRQYAINEIFYSLQGEGVRAGTANVFIRFAGCNQRCLKETHGFDCDTEFVSSYPVDPVKLLADAIRIGGICRNVIFTGGEPGLQLDVDLVQLFKKEGFYTAIETNGSIDVSGLGLDWITVSPKVAEHAIRQVEASEVKYVRGYGQAIPKTVVKAENYLISPAFNGITLEKEALEWCVGLVKKNPMWRLSVQAHKFWLVR